MLKGSAEGFVGFKTQGQGDVEDAPVRIQQFLRRFGQPPGADITADAFPRDGFKDTLKMIIGISRRTGGVGGGDIPVQIVFNVADGGFDMAQVVDGGSLLSSAAVDHFVE